MIDLFRLNLSFFPPLLPRCKENVTITKASPKIKNKDISGLLKTAHKIKARSRLSSKTKHSIKSAQSLALWVTDNLHFSQVLIMLRSMVQCSPKYLQDIRASQVVCLTETNAVTPYFKCPFIIQSLVDSKMVMDVILTEVFLWPTRCSYKVITGPICRNLAHVVWKWYGYH